ncbi:MAG: hypothetical protein HKM07_03595 [Chlamydiae bacterium]|jgi:hypothetical protein|nr:hypothetical protein [Chlamydiota bacterium]
MSKYRAFVHYHFKKGMEEKGMKFLENELFKKAQTYGCHGLELLQNEVDSCQVLGIGFWNSLEEAKKFQSVWDSKEKELMEFCERKPNREFCKVRTTYAEKAKKAA